MPADEDAGGQDFAPGDLRNAEGCGHLRDTKPRIQVETEGPG